MSLRIYTIGHSTLTFEAFAALLAGAGVERLADVRRYPGSRRLPQFGSAELAAALANVGIGYLHLEALGGRRRPLPGSPNGAWRSDQFRGYADHMGTAEFRAGMERLLEDRRTTTVMCAESVPWRCHRNLLSDDLVRRGLEVLHIMSDGTLRPHTPMREAVFETDRVVYPAAQAPMFG